MVPGPGTASSLKVVLLKATIWSKVKVVPDPGMSSGVGGSSSSGEEGELLLFPSSNPRVTGLGDPPPYISLWASPKWLSCHLSVATAQRFPLCS